MFLLNYNAKVWIIFRLSKLNEEKYQSIGQFLIYIKHDKSIKVSLFLFLSSMRQKGVGLVLRNRRGEVRAKRKRKNVVNVSLLFSGKSD